MLKSPSALKQKPRRKGIPSRAPRSTGKLPAISTSGALLLLALLREGRKGSSLDNIRYQIPSPLGSAGATDGKRRRAERDCLPPPDFAYGRGKRSASASVSVSGEGAGDTRHNSPESQQQRGGGAAASRTAGSKRTAGGTNRQGSPGSNKRIKRADSSEPLGIDGQHLSVPSSYSSVGVNNLPPAGARNATRASSAGPAPPHHLPSPHPEHVPSPLARSFSADGEAPKESG